MSVWDSLQNAFRVLAANAGEDLVYTSGGVPRTITGTVERKPRETGTGAGRVISAPLIVEVLNDAVEGITPAQLNLGGDTITVAERIGKTAEARVIAAIVAQDQATIRLELR